MLGDGLTPIVICAILFIGLPWIILHYSSQWRRAKGISIEDERLLDDLHDTARRLDARLELDRADHRRRQPRLEGRGAGQRTSRRPDHRA